jgi:GT2 family glycosyltransferase
VQQHYPAIKIIKNTDNFGFAQGYNEALKHIDAEIYALVNSDIEVTANLSPRPLKRATNSDYTA